MKLSVFSVRPLLILLFGLFMLMSPFFLAAAEEKPADSAAKTTDNTEEQKTTLINIYSWATILPKELIDLQNEIANEKKIKVVEDNLPVLAEEIATIRKETSAVQKSPELQGQQVSSLQDRTQRVGARLQNAAEPITKRITLLSENRKQWIEKKDDIVNIKKQEEIPLIIGKDQHTKMRKTVDEALLIIEEQLKIVLNVGKKIGDLQIVLYGIDSDLQALEKTIRETSIQKTAPSMLSSEFYSQINLEIFPQSFHRTVIFFSSFLHNMKVNLSYVLLGCLAFGLVAFGAYKTKDYISPESRWAPFAKRPVATAIFMGSSLNVINNIFPLNADIPEQWKALFHIITLFAVIRLTKHLPIAKAKRKLLTQLSLFLSVTMIFLLLDFPKVLLLLYVFFSSILALFYYISRLPLTKGKDLAEVWQQKIWGILPVIVIISGIAGYSEFAVMTFLICLWTIIACLIIWVLYLFHLGILELILSFLPITVVRENYKELLEKVRPFIAWFHILILVAIQSVIWEIYPTINEAFFKIFNFGFDIGDVHISLKFIFTVGIIFYGAILISKTIQTVLLKKILPRYKAEKGVQLSITRLVHYAILTVGFFVMLGVLGFQLNQITLLGGALGVGIGFGLQAIVNNFASGLILLFERPIKVGDTIQIGSELGEVKQLGLRATVIQTFDNAEIVIPNSDLVTGQVTNWTLGDRRVRVKIPVGVAYGSDVAKVLEILISCGKANPMVLSTPKVSAFFLAFGASSLDFELRVWIPEFLDKLQVLSDLNQDIENEFSMNNIEIPFPQSDLHLRSIDEGVAEQLKGGPAIMPDDGLTTAQVEEK
jgi:small-conductance mechanosensitive channel